MGSDVGKLKKGVASAELGAVRRENGQLRKRLGMLRTQLTRAVMPTGQLLHFAARAGNEAEVDVLLARGADINWTNERGSTALLQAVRYATLRRAALLCLIAGRHALAAVRAHAFTPEYSPVYTHTPCSLSRARASARCRPTVCAGRPCE